MWGGGLGLPPAISFIGFPKCVPRNCPRYPCRWAVPCPGLWSWIGNVSKADRVCPQLKRERERAREERDPSVRPECSMWPHGPVRLGGAADSGMQERETPTRLAIRAQIYWSVQIESGKHLRRHGGVAAWKGSQPSSRLLRSSSASLCKHVGIFFHPQGDPRARASRARSPWTRSWLPVRLPRTLWRLG